MRRTLQNDFPRALIHRRGWLCLLLPLLFLYNPFLGAQVSTGTLFVGHLASYRATLASSELLKFKKIERPEPAPIADYCELPGVHFMHLPLPANSSRIRDTAEVPRKEQFRTHNLWFRPPPAV